MQRDVVGDVFSRDRHAPTAPGRISPGRWGRLPPVQLSSGSVAPPRRSLRIAVRTGVGLLDSPQNERRGPAPGPTARPGLLADVGSAALPQHGQSFSASVRSWTTPSRRCSRCSAQGGAAMRVAWRPGLRPSFAVRRAGHAFGAAALSDASMPHRALPSTSAWSARSRVSSARPIAGPAASQGRAHRRAAANPGSARRRPCLPKHRCRRRVGAIFSRSAGRKTLEAFDAGEVDAVEDHLELPDGQLRTPGGGRSGVGK